METLFVILLSLPLLGLGWLAIYFERRVKEAEYERDRLIGLIAEHARDKILGGGL